MGEKLELNEKIMATECANNRVIPKCFALIIMVAAALSSTAQTGVVSSGGNGTGSGGSMSITLGLPDYFVATGAGGSASLGLQHGYDNGIMWTGAISTDWSTGSNWNKGVVPATSDSAIITAYPTNQPHITTAPGSYTSINDIVVRTGATLTIDAGKALTVSQTLNSDGTVIVNANASNIGSLITNGTISGSGNFKMQQYLTGSGGATPNGLFYYVGSPVSDATAATYNIGSGNKLWSADETTTSYPQISNAATVLNPLTGYVARMGADGVFTFSGSTYNTGAQANASLTRTGTTDSNRGYNLQSNPYPSSVSWDQAQRTNLSTTLWYRTHQGNTMLYDTYNATSSIGTNNNGNGAVTGVIPPTQAFWVRVPTDGLSGALSFDDYMRSHTEWSSIYKLASEEGTVRLTLSNGNVSDETIVAFNSDAEDGFDDFDSQKFWAGSSVPQMYTTTDADTLVINGLESVANNPVVDLGIKIPVSGNYTISATEITLAESVYLEDRLLNVFQDLNINPNYDFTNGAGNFPLRFALHFGLSITDVEVADAFVAHVFSDGALVHISLSREVKNGTAQVYDMSGKLIQIQPLPEVQTAFQLNSATGIYLVRVSCNEGTSTHKIHLR